jgi:hypothetical protein
LSNNVELYLYSNEMLNLLTKSSLNKSEAFMICNISSESYSYWYHIILKYWILFLSVIADNLILFISGFIVINSNLYTTPLKL